jgi:hypothetical protein
MIRVGNSSVQLTGSHLHPNKTYMNPDTEISHVTESVKDG